VSLKPALLHLREWLGTDACPPLQRNPMPAYIRSCLALTALASTLAGCAAGAGEPASPSDEGGGGDDSGASFDSSSGVGQDSGTRAGPDSSASEGMDSGSSAGFDSGSSESLDSGSSVGPDSGSDGASTSGVDSGGDAHADAGSATDAGSTAACSFASGLNVAWVNFANDVPNPPTATFNTLFKNTYAAGGRVVRWWFHTNGTVTPGYQTSGAQAGMAQKLPQSHIDGVKSILAAAHSAGVALNISLWSFDMLQGSSEGISSTTTTNNTNLLQVDANRQAYIDNYLTPLVTALKGTPGLYSYEIFNEPEGMTATGWSTYRTTEAHIQTCVNQFAAAIHAADPTVLVTNGSQEFQYCSNASGKTNYYSDAALRSAGGMANGTLDFYEVHYYASNGVSNSCFMHPASYWGLDKKVVMGEFYAQTTDGVSQDDTYTYLYSNGYNGAWAWSYVGTTDAWPTMQVPMQDVYSAHSAEVGSCP
jgi:hypothetical protein